MRRVRPRQIAYRYMKEKIQTGDWLNDYHVVEQNIADKLSISRSPVREAIQQLIAEGYMSKIVNKGVIVDKLFLTNNEFIERTQVIELMCSHLLYQLQIKDINVNSTIFTELEFSEELLLDEQREVFLFKWEQFVAYFDNRIMAQSVMDSVRMLTYVNFPNESISFLYKETDELFSKMSQQLSNKDFDIARKSIRVFINRLNLELIDQQG